jgi:hypothetical protein
MFAAAGIFNLVWVTIGGAMIGGNLCRDNTELHVALSVTITADIVMVCANSVGVWLSWSK